MISRRLSLWALAIVFPVALWVAIGDNWLTYREKNREQMVDAPAGAPFDFEGATWRLEGAEIVPPGNAGPLPPNTMRVLMRISVTAKDAAVAERLRMCTVALRSEGGKRWTPGGGEYRSQSGLPGLCGGTFRAHPEAGQAFRFEATFIVPTSAVDDVEPIILLPRRTKDPVSPSQLRLRRS